MVHMTRWAMFRVNEGQEEARITPASYRHAIPVCVIKLVWQLLPIVKSTFIEISSA